MKWHVIHTKPQQEFRAEENLKSQGYEVYLPTCQVQKLSRGKLGEREEALFARYLFIQLDDVNSNWFPIRSTRGVSQLLRFSVNTDPVVVADELIDALKKRAQGEEPMHELFQKGESVEIKEGPFKGLGGFYEEITNLANGEARAMLLVDFLGKSQRLSVSLNQIQKT